jgi:hypothetical protein
MTTDVDATAFDNSLNAFYDAHPEQLPQSLTYGPYDGGITPWPIA